MITIKEFPNQTFSDKAEMFQALRESKSDLIAQKKMSTKYADSVLFAPVLHNEKGETVKALSIDHSVTRISAKLVINTINILDSHGDVHLKGIWNKSVKEKRDLYLLQEHKMKFDHIITDDVTAKVEEMTWKELGATYSGSTEALVFDVNIDNRNEYMFKQYASGYVKNHSVGMRYVKLALALNSEEKFDQEEKEVWDKYIDSIVNKAEAEALGYFWAVHEAKIIEGSAVPIGSNTITPTLNIEAGKTTSKNEPVSTTQTVSQMIQNVKINL